MTRPFAETLAGLVGRHDERMAEGGPYPDTPAGRPRSKIGNSLT